MEVRRKKHTATGTRKIRTGGGGVDERQEKAEKQRYIRKRGERGDEEEG